MDYRLARNVCWGTSQRHTNFVWPLIRYQASITQWDSNWSRLKLIISNISDLIYVDVTNRSTTTEANVGVGGTRWFRQTCPTRDVIGRTKHRSSKSGNVTSVNVGRSGNPLVVGLSRGSIIFAENSCSSNSSLASVSESRLFRTPITRVLFLFEDSFVVAVSTEAGNVFRFKIDWLPCIDLVINL